MFGDKFGGNGGVGQLALVERSLGLGCLFQRPVSDEGLAQRRVVHEVGDGPVLRAQRVKKTALQLRNGRKYGTESDMTRPTLQNASHNALCVTP